MWTDFCWKSSVGLVADTIVYVCNTIVYRKTKIMMVSYGGVLIKIYLFTFLFLYLYYVYSYRMDIWVDLITKLIIQTNPIPSDFIKIILHLNNLFNCTLDKQLSNIPEMILFITHLTY